GNYTLAGVPVGGFTLTADSRTVQPQLFGAGQGQITSNNQTVPVNIALSATFRPVNIPLFDVNGFKYNLTSNGSIANGETDFFAGDFAANDGGYNLEVIADGAPPVPFTGQPTATTDQSGRQLAISQQNVAGIDITRKIFVPRTGYFARYLEVLTNPGATARTLSVRLSTNVRFISKVRDGFLFDVEPRIVNSSSGDANLSVSPADRDNWIMIDDDDDSDPFVSNATLTGFQVRSGVFNTLPQVVHVFDGPGGADSLDAGSLTQNFTGRFARLVEEWQNVTVPAGGTVAFLHFTSQQTSRNAARASADRLAQLPPEALAGLTAAELTQIRNFNAPPGGISSLPPLPELLGTVQGKVLAADGETAIPNASVSFRSRSPLFGRTFTATSDNSGSFRYLGQIQDGGSRPVPISDFSVSATLPSLNLMAPAVTGSFSTGSTSAARDVIFSGTGTLSGVVRRANGLVLSTGNIQVTGSVLLSALSDRIGIDGSFGFDALPPGNYNVVATVPNPQGTGLQGTATAAISSGLVTPVSVVLETSGAVSGTLRRPDGSAVIGLSIALRGTGLQMTAVTDTGGRFAFFDVRTGTWTLEAFEGSSRGYASAPVTVTPDATATAALTLATASISSLTPGSARQGETVDVELSGVATSFVQGNAQPDFGSGISIVSTTVTSPTRAVVRIQIATNAAIGTRTVNIRFGNLTASLPDGFSVLPGNPLLSGVVPGSGAQAQNTSVTITGQNTRFAQGTTSVSFGAGVLVNSLSVSSATSVTAQITVSPIAVAGVRSVTVTTGSEVVTAPSAFTIQAATFDLSSISPDVAGQGTTLNVTILGANTFFQQGLTAVSLGAGVTVNSVTVTSPLSLAANVTIAPLASAGARAVVVTTAGQTAFRAAAFSVIAATPSINSVIPATGRQGETISVVIGGQFTSFAAGTTFDFGAGIATNSVVVSSPTSATASITISPTATPGTRNLIARTQGQTVTLNNAFSIQAATFTLLSVTPAAGDQGSTLTVAIAGQNTSFVQGSTSASFGSGISLNSLTISSPTAASASITIAAGASVGPRTVTLTTGGQVASLANAFAVRAATPVITTVAPASGTQGQTLDVTITGSFTSFAAASAASFGAGITVNSTTLLSATQVRANLTISATAALGSRTVTVTTGGAVVTRLNGFEITEGAASLLSVNPATGDQGSTLTVAVVGQNTSFAQGTTTASFGAGITVNSLTVSGPTAASASITVSALAAAGPRTVTLTTGGQTASLANGFTVRAATPVITTLTPATGAQGQTLNITINGSFTTFTAASVASFGAGVVVNGTTFVSATQVRADITISAIAALGTRNVSVTTGSVVATRANAFDITSGSATLSSVAPAAGDQGSTLTVAIVGQNTAFAQGSTTASFGAGITVNSLTVTSPTAASASISIAALAVAGPRTVTLTTGGQVASLANAFTVRGATPVISTVVPGSGAQSQTLDVTITGSFTGFTAASVADFGAGITVNSTTLLSASQVRANITVSAIAAPGLRNVAVNTGTENASKLNAFEVIAGQSTILSVTPATGRQGQSVTVQITGQNTSFSAATQADFGQGIQVGTVQASSPTSATILVNILPSASAGLRTVTLTTSGQTARLVNGFTVQAGIPVISSVNPANARQGETGLSVTISGTYTSFVNGTTTASFGSGITVRSVVVQNSTTATAVLDVDPIASPGNRQVTLTTGTETATLNPGFSVQQGSSRILSLSPNQGEQGQTVTVNILGSFTNFGPATVVSFGGGITTGAITVNGPTDLSVAVNLSNAVATGPRTVTVTTGTEVVTSSFNVLPGNPGILTITPNVGVPGQTVAVALQGRFTNWQTGVTRAKFGEGISVGGAAAGDFGPVTVSGQDRITAQINVAGAATLGPRDVIVQTGTQTLNVLQGFTLTTADTTRPSVLRTGPVNGQTDVPLNASLTVEFNEPIDRTTLILANVSLFDYTAGTLDLTGATLSLDASGRIATFRLGKLLLANHQHQFYLNNNIKDPAGNRLIDYAFNFTTSFTPQTTGPMLTGTSPAAADGNVPLNTLVVLRFSKSINPTTQPAGLALQSGGVPIPGTWTYADQNRRLAFDPAAALAASTSYAIVLNSQLQDDAGNAVVNPGSTTFTTGTASDTVASQILSYNPPANQPSVGRNIEPTAYFSERINPLLLSTSNFYFYLADTGQVLASTIQVAPDRQSAKLVPAAQLLPNTSYRWYLANTTDLAGNTGGGINVLFTTGTASDSALPQVSAINPPNGVNGVPVNIRPAATFSEPINVTVFPANAMRLLQGSTPVAGAFAFSAGGTLMTFTPASALTTSTLYTVQISGLRDLSGNALPAFSSVFTTSATGTSDTTGPQVSSVTPAHPATNVAGLTPLVFTFNEAINPASVSEQSIRIAIEGDYNDVIGGTFSVNGSVVTFTPVQAWPGGRTVRRRICYNFCPQDLAGNQAQYYETAFTTGGPADATPPSILSVSPQNGSVGVGRAVTVVLTFSESLDASTIHGNNFALFNGFQRLGTSVQRSQDNRTVFLTANLPGDAIITVIATRDVKDLSGNSLVDFRSEFRTIPETSTNRPSIISQRPGNGASAVGRNSEITLYADKLLNAATLANNVRVTQDGVLITGTFSLTSGGYGIRFRPDSQYQSNALIEIFANENVRDTGGNSLQGYNGNFRIVPNVATAAPQIVRTSIVPGIQERLVSSVLDIELSEDIDPATVNSTTVQLRGPNNNSTIVTTSLTIRNGRIIRIAPAADLLPNVYYYWFVGAGVKDLQGQSLQNPQNTYFYTRNDATPDQNGPTVVAVAPPDGSTGIGVNALLRVTFSEEINPLTIDSNTVRISSGVATSIPASISFGQDNREITLTPLASLPETSTVSIAINGVQDTSANPVTPRTVQFTTSATADVVRPTVIRSSIPSGANNIAINSVFTLEFSEPVDSRTIVTNNNNVLYLYDNVINQYLPFTLSFAGDLKSITLAPIAPLGVGRAHQLYLQNYRDLAGNPGSALYLQFTTAFQTDNTPPQISLSNPGGQLPAPINSQIEILFNEPIQETSLASVNLIRGGAPQPVVRELSNGRRTLSLTPMKPLQENSAHTISVSEVRDSSGNILSGTVSRNFTTGPGADLVPPPTPTYSPASGATNVGRNSQMKAFFTEPVNPISLTSTNFRIYVQNTGVIVPSTFTVAADLLSATLVPSSPLQPNTTYQFQGYSITDRAGNSFPSFNSGFTTGIGSDSVAPSVTAINPANGAAGIPVNIRITAYLSEQIEQAVLPANAFRLRQGTTAIPGTTVLSTDRRSLTFTPTSSLAISSAYTVEISGLRDSSGNQIAAFSSTFTTGATGTPDSTGPTLTSLTPVNQAAGVPVTTPLTFTFSEPVNPATVNADTIRIYLQQNGNLVVAGTFAVSGNVVTFTPAQPYPASSRITRYINYSGPVQDLAGNNAQTSSTFFDTASTADAVEPEVLSVSPANNATGVGRDVTVVLTFSESLDPSTVNQTNISLFAGSTRIGTNITRSTDNRTLFLTGSLAGGALISVVVNGSVTDLSGNRLPEFRSQFTTLNDSDTQRPSIVSQRPGSGAQGVDRGAKLVLYATKPLNASSVTGGLRVSQNGALITGSVQLTNGGQVIEFTPSVPFAYGSFVQVFVEEFVRDLAGNLMNAYSGSFRITPDPVPVPPTVVRYSIQPGSQGQPRNPVIEIEYSEPLDPTTIIPANVELRGPNNNSSLVPSTITLRNGNIVRIRPQSTLTAGAYYYWFVGTGIKDMQGTSPTSANNTYFYAGDQTDTIAPAAPSIAPVNGSTSVGTNAYVRVTFNSPINPLTGDGNTLRLTGPGTTAIPVTLSVTNNNSEFVLTPLTVLPTAAQITVTINGIQDISGNVVPTTTSQFTTGSGPDLTPAQVVAVSFAYNQTNVPVNPVLTIEWTEPVDMSRYTAAEGTACSGNIYLYSYATAQCVPGTLSFSSDRRRLNFTPTAPLTTQTQHSWYVGSSVDFSGNNAPGVGGQLFTTAATPDTTVPQVLFTNPANGLSGVPVNAAIQILFSEPIQPTSASLVTLTSSGSLVAATRSFSEGNRLLTLTPVDLLGNNRTFTLSITGIRDLAGNQLAPVTRSFTTGSAFDAAGFASYQFTPVQGTINLPLSTSPSVVFTEPVNMVRLVADSSLTLRVNATNIVVPVAYTLSTDGRTVTMNPAASLSPNTQYVIRATTVVDWANNNPSANATATFTTVP
ncbi:MAG: Ig-like domain-containing protein, partial [Bryobacteraceae bacterium]|nr:Ig-like domain-containing protein [Bryobacteraceae bacterium]